jgi:hypothetical protein
MPQSFASRMTPEEQRKHNLRLGVILATIALAFFVGIIAKAVLFGL